jgi:hypothetical protein
MLFINGVEVLAGVYLLEPNIEYKVSTYTDDQVVTFAQTGHTLVMNAGANNKAFTLPSPAAANVGCEFTFANTGTGRLTINVAGTGVKIANSTATTGTIYCDDDGYAALKLRLVSATQWSVVGGHGTWTTT